MLFCSYLFIFLFLPIVLFGYYIIGKYLNFELGKAWLILGSIIFYAWWNPKFVLLLGLSVVVNFFLGKMIYRLNSKLIKKRMVFYGAVTFNLFLIVYFKYANFFIDNVNVLTGTNLGLGKIILPLGISFYTFQQVAYIVDVYKGTTYEKSFLNYFLFATFFPQIINGPIVHHSETIPQFRDIRNNKKIWSNISIGITIFFIGLFKKVVIADGIAGCANAIFGAAEAGTTLTIFEAWAGALSYAFQIYFDFSGYSDMAIGASRLFGIKLPLNFVSPYKSRNIIEFWRRWHLTLSRFLRDYVYIPLGGNRKSPFRRYVNLLITMLLGGLWHGANWTFVVWGLLHGILLVANHLWRSAISQFGIPRSLRESALSYWFSRLITFAFVVIAWVLFRADNLGAGIEIIKSMVGINGFSVPISVASQLGLQSYTPALANHITEIPVGNLVVIFILAFFCAETHEIMSDYDPALEVYGNELKPPRFSILKWNPSIRWALIIIVISLIGILNIGAMNEFIYFRF